MAAALSQRLAVLSSVAVIALLAVVVEVVVGLLYTLFPLHAV
jgi:hypothetical protein